MIILLKILGLLPLYLRIAIGRLGGLLFSLLPTREKRIAELQLKAVLGRDQTFPIICKMFMGLGQTVMECLNLKPYLKNTDKYISCPEYGLYESLSKDTRPIVILTAHTGNWDLLAAYGVSRGIPITSVAKEARNKSLQRTLESIRRGYGSRTIWRANRAGVREIIRDISKGQVVAALIDQDTRVTNIRSHFFKLPVCAPSGLLDVANKLNAQYLAVFIGRVGWNKYHVSIKELPSNCSKEETIKEYHNALESHIMKFPDQWVWFHKRWRSLSNGKRLSSKEYITHLSNLISQESDSIGSTTR